MSIKPPNPTERVKSAQANTKSWPSVTAECPKTLPGAPARPPHDPHSRTSPTRDTRDHNSKLVDFGPNSRVRPAHRPLVVSSVSPAHQKVDHRGLQVADLRGSVLRCPGHKSFECAGVHKTERMARASRLLPRFCPGRTLHVGRSSLHAANHPFFGCCITDKKQNVNHCDVTKAYFGILTANRWKATYQNVHPDHSNTQHQH